MFFALLRRIFAFASFVLLVAFALIFVHTLREGGEFAWTVGLGAATAGIVLALSWIGMVKTDDYLTPPHGRAFLIVTATLTGLTGFGLLGYFLFSDAYTSSYLHFFGMAPAGVAILFIIVAQIRMKEAYNLPSEYRPDVAGSSGVALMIPSIAVLILSVGSLAVTMKDFEFQSQFDPSLPEPTASAPQNQASRQLRAQEALAQGREHQAANHYRRAFESFAEAAELGHPEGHFELALIFSGDGYLRDLEKAQEHLAHAAEKDHLEATFRLGKAFRHGELGLKVDYEKARQYLEVAATAGHLEAQTQLGHLYNRGDGVEPDLERAFHWFLQAAEQGDAVAQNDVGIFYLQGKGVAADPVQGIEWLTRAADQGVAVAEYNVGRAYYSGELVPQDYQRAFTYFRSLADKNIPYGFQMIGLQYLHGNGAAKDEEKAFQAFAEGAARGDALSSYYLGLCYLKGLGTAKDTSAALTCLENAARRNIADAQLLLGRIYLEGAILLQDKVEAAKWFELAAANNAVGADAELQAVQQELTEQERTLAADRVAAFRRDKG